MIYKIYDDSSEDDRYRASWLDKYESSSVFASIVEKYEEKEYVIEANDERRDRLILKICKK